jgi:uncharacterized membrane protein
MFSHKQPATVQQCRLGMLERKRSTMMFDLAAYHPLIVHAPLVLLPVAVLFSVLSLFFPRAGLRLTAILLLVGGVLGAILATETGEAAEEQAEDVTPAVKSISDAGRVPLAVADGNLLETHAQLGELTRNLYGLLLLVEGGVVLASTPVLARFRRGWTLPARTERITRWLWTLVAVAGMVVVVWTGHYGGKLVYEHAIGVTPSAVQPGSSTSSLNVPAEDSDEH